MNDMYQQYKRKEKKRKEQLRDRREHFAYSLADIDL